MTATRRLTAAGLCLALLAACGGGLPPVSNPAPAAPVVPAKERLVAAIEEAGCLLTVDNRDAILLRANVGLTDLAVIVPELNAEGRAEAAGDGQIRILSANCI